MNDETLETLNSVALYGHFKERVRQYEEAKDFSNHIEIINSKYIMYIWYTTHGEWKYAVETATEYSTILNEGFKLQIRELIAMQLYALSFNDVEECRFYLDKLIELLGIKYGDKI